MAPDTPRALYVLLLAATALLVGIAVGNSARAECDPQFSYPLGNAYVCAGTLPEALVVSPVEPYMPTFQTLAPGGGTINAMPIVYGSGVPYLPDPAKTPGSFYPDDEATICGKVNGLTYEKRSRASLTQAMKNAITRSYGQEPGQDGDHELDHRGPAALGGKSDASNVWWQPGKGHGTVWDFHVKDRLDTFAWRQVCVLHKVPLETAQAWFMEPDWTRVYCREMGGPPCEP